MDTAPFITPGYSTPGLVLVGLLISTFVLGGLISLLYWLNTRIRRGMKDTRDDWRVEQDIESGNTLHAEGIYGSRHPEEGGRHLSQEDPHPILDGLRTSLKHPSADEERRNVF